jgi:hypothetical protein
MMQFSGTELHFVLSAAASGLPVVEGGQINIFPPSVGLGPAPSLPREESMPVSIHIP